MKKKYQRVVAMLVIAMMILLPGCGKTDSKEVAKEGTEVAEIKGETYETSLLSVLVPEGWMAFPKADIFEEYPDEPGDPSGLLIYKGAQDDLDAFTKPGITIDYYPPEKTMVSPKSYYDDAKDLDPITTGEYTWEGFTATSLDKPLTVLSVTEPYQIQVSVWTDVDDGHISLEDADLQAILASLKIK